MGVPFVQAKWYHPGGNLPVHRIVVHTMEAPEKGDTAESTARYFAAGSGGRQASAHYCVDNNSIVQCVKETDIAFHAPPNTGSIGIEHAGYARQTPADWADPYSLAMLDYSARLAADLCLAYHLPIVKRSPADLKAGKQGLCGHVDVSYAFGLSTHTDPGPAFPWAMYLDLVRHYAGETDLTPEESKQLQDTVDAVGRIETLVAQIDARQSRQGLDLGTLKDEVAAIKAKLDA